MRRLPPLILLVGLLAGPLLGPAGGQAATVEEVRARMEAQGRFRSLSGVQEMALLDPAGGRRTRQMRVWILNQERASHRLAVFTGPAEFKGVAFLGHDSPEESEQWLFLPALGRAKRVGGADRGQPFLGSDFTLGDLSGFNLAQWRLELAGEETVDGRPAWRLAARPAGPSAAELGYDRLLLTVRQDNACLVRATYWLADSPRRKELVVQELGQVQGVWLGLAAEMRTFLQDRLLHATALRLREVQLDQDLDPDLFTVRRLERGF